ncbi:potassium channel subfamily K member 18 isoform X2 [Daphnia magna]|nr:potassium channel subfamily K member 18 isoform X2 [Daphnia magna]XP_045032419.1 potassium channel subfamily K member 18 isoform X2 [Daphnia magna]
MENGSRGDSMKRPSKNTRRTGTDCRSSSAKISLMFFFLAYVSLGAYVFMLIEASSTQFHHQQTPPTEEIRTAIGGTLLTTTGPTTTTIDGISDTSNAADVTQIKDLMTRQVLDKLWDITENLNILYKENWTRLAAGEIYRFHETMYLWMKKDCNNRRKSQEMMVVGHQLTTASTPSATAGHRQHISNVKWNYPTAFLYALSVITTLGSCPVIPESNEGKILTILYAAFGIPLLLFYLTAVGSTFSSCLMQCPLLDFRYHSSPSSRRRRDQLSSAASGHNMSAVPTSVMTTRLDPSLSHHQQTNELLFHHPMKTATAVVKDDESIEATSSTSSSNDANRRVLRIHSFWPPLFCLILILIFIASGTCVFSSLMSLSTMDALLLSFMLLTTTGIPDAHSVVWTGQSSWPLMAVSIYIFLALTLCSICFSLIYEWLLSEGSSVDSCEASVESDGTRHRRSNSLLRS